MCTYHVANMVLKACVISAILIASVLGSPVTKDLASDIFLAERAVNFFEIETNELTNRAVAFQGVVELQLTTDANTIRDLLQNLQVTIKNTIVYLFVHAP
jgi:hypothetical protein